MNRELLTACCSRTCEQTSLVLSKIFFQYIEYALIIKICVEVVHLDRVRAVIVNNISCRYSLTKVCLECVNTHFAELSQISCIPLASLRISEVNNSHTRLPLIALEYRTVSFLDEVAVLHTLVKEL